MIIKEWQEGGEKWQISSAAGSTGDVWLYLRVFCSNTERYEKVDNLGMPTDEYDYTWVYRTIRETSNVISRWLFGTVEQQTARAIRDFENIVYKYSQREAAELKRKLKARELEKKIVDAAKQ